MNKMKKKGCNNSCRNSKINKIEESRCFRMYKNKSSNTRMIGPNLERIAVGSIEYAQLDLEKETRTPMVKFKKANNNGNIKNHN